MYCLGVFMVVVVSVVVVLTCCCCFFFYREKYEKPQPAWHNEATDEFIRLFERPIDPVHLAYYKRTVANLSQQRALRVVREDMRKHKEEVMKGVERAKDKRIVVAGLLQNAADQVPDLIARCQKLVSYFKDYRIVVLENNSTDGSRDELLAWAARDHRVKVLCQNPYIANADECLINASSSNVKDKSPMPDRIRKMATLRNIYIAHVGHYYKDFDYLCVMDMDLEGELFVDGFLHSVRLLDNPKVDGVACNGMIRADDDSFYYYDSFAYVEQHDPPFLNDMSEKSEHDNYVHIYMTQLYCSQMIPDRVRSAFGGCVLYKLDPALRARYDFSQNSFVCEHTYFHKDMRVYVNPRMVFMITKNG